MDLVEFKKKKKKNYQFLFFLVYECSEHNKCTFSYSHMNDKFYHEFNKQDSPLM